MLLFSEPLSSFSALVRGSVDRTRLLVQDVPDSVEIIAQVARGESFAPPDPEGRKTVVVAVGPNGESDYRVQYEAGRLLSAICILEEGAKRVWNVDDGETVKKVFELMKQSKFDVLKMEAAEGQQRLSSYGFSC